MLTSLWMMMSQPALADEPPAPAVMAEARPAVAEASKTHYEINFRGRMMSVPDSMMNIWFYDEEGDDYGVGLPARPKLNGYAVGLEFVVKGDSANGMFYFDYGSSLMKPGYFDDVEEPPDHLDGDYVVPTKNFGFVAFGANVAPEVHIVRTAKTNGAFGLSLLPGGGLGVGVVSGRLDTWLPCHPDNYSADRYPNGCGAIGDPSPEVFASGVEAVKDKVPFRVFPMVDINLALRFNFGNRAVLRVEGGLHTLVYYGATLGIMF
jgi:hypothetical protein